MVAFFLLVVKLGHYIQVKLKPDIANFDHGANFDNVILFRNEMNGEAVSGWEGDFWELISSKKWEKKTCFKAKRAKLWDFSAVQLGFWR